MSNFIFIISFLIISCANAQQWEKAKTFNTLKSYSSGLRQITDKYGNIYVVGNFFENPITFENTTLISKGNSDIFLVKLDSNFNVIWAKSFGNEDEDIVTGIAISPFNDLVICGYYNNLLIFGKDSIISKGLSDFFITKLDSNGNPKWAKSGGSKYKEYSVGRLGGVFIDSLNNIYTTGMFGDEYNSGKPNYYSAYFDTLSIQSFGNQDVFVAKYSPDGDAIWVKNFGSDINDIGELNSDGKFIYVSGGSAGNFNYGTGIIKNPYGGTDFGFVLKMDFDGKIIWVNGPFLKEFGSLYSRSVTTDSKGNLYLLGLYYPISFKNKLVLGNYELSEIGGIDIFIAKFDKNGNVKWLKKAGGGSNDAATKIITKNNNHFIITGDLAGGGIYDNKTIESMSGSNTFILEIDSNGKPIIFEQCGNTGSNSGSDLSITFDHKLIIVGENRSGTLTFDSITCQPTDKPASFYIARRNFIAKPVGVEKVIKSNPFKIYPNPSSGNFTIEVENANKNGFISIYNPMGMLIKNITIDSPNKLYGLELDVTSGIYFVNIKIGDETFSQTISIVN